MRPRAAILLGLLGGLLLGTRLAHAGVLWIEEAYGMAAAAELLRGKVLYRDIWFDKPPLYAAIYVLCGAHMGVGLRVLEAAYCFLAVLLAYAVGRSWWGEREGLWAGVLLGWGLSFGVPSAVLPLAPDLLTVAPHLAAVGLASAGRSVGAGLAAGMALLSNAKGVLVLAASLPWRRSGLLVGIAGAVAAAVVVMLSPGDFWHQVVRWGAAYARDSLIANPPAEGLKRTLNWAGFHLTAVAGTLYCLWREPARQRRRLLVWVLISCAAVSAGWRFFPRYYLHLLAPVSILGGRGLALMARGRRLALALLLVIPMVRFGWMHVEVARGVGHRDLAMFEQSRAASVILKQQAPPGATLLVWGYRPDLYVLSGLPAGTRFLDSQPLTGVLADRHLTSAQATLPEEARANRQLLRQSRPTFIADGLGPYNEQLAVSAFPDLQQWLSEYELFASPAGYRLYRLKP